MRTEKQIEKFYAQWSLSVLAFCCALLGTGSDAEKTTVEAFQGYLSRELDLDFVQVPALLFIFANEAARKLALPPPAESTEALQDAVVFLPWKKRAVFALRGPLGFEDGLVSEIVEIPIREVRRMWIRSLFRLRTLLPRDFFPGRAK
jgi:hypothetical protein